MSKLSTTLFILTVLVIQSGCAKKTTLKKSAAEDVVLENCAPIYDNNNTPDFSHCKNKPKKIKNTKIGDNQADSSTDSSDYFVQTGRYTVIRAKPTRAQSNLLDVMITVTIPKDIRSIDATIRYLLKRSGYHMPIVSGQETEVVQLLSKPLPEIHRKIGPMRLIDALSMLTTPAFELKTNPVKREVKYQLKARYSYNPGVQS